MAWSGGTFSRTNGVNSGSTLWASDRDDGTAILAARHDTHDQDLADGINACIAKDGSNAFSGNVNLGSNKIINLADGSASTDAANLSQVGTKVQDRQNAVITIVNSATETTLYDYAVPANTLGTTRGLRVKAFGHIENDSGSNCRYTIKFYYGSTSVTTVDTYTVGTGNTDGWWDFDGILWSAGATGAQRISTVCRISNAGGDGTTTVTPNQYFLGKQDCTEDSTGILTLKITGQMDPADASNAIDLQCGFSEIL